MASEWVVVALADIVKLRNGAGIKQQYFTVDPSGVPLIKVSNFSSSSIEMKELTLVDGEHAQSWNSHRLEPDDMLVATVGSWPPNWSSVVGKVVRAPRQAAGALQNQNTCCLVPSQKIDKNFLFYRLKTMDFLLWVSNVAQGSANQARVPVKQLGTFQFNLPSLSEQRHIGSLLRSLDNKIELNCQTNQTLESMAQALFKSWFVDFDPVIDNALAVGNEIPPKFAARAEARQSAQKSGLPASIRQLFPSSFVQNADMGWIPEGWEVKTIREFGNVVCGKTPSKKKDEYYGGDIPFIKIPDTHGKMYIVETSESLSLQGDSSQPKKRIPAQSVCVSCIATVGQVFLTSSVSHTNQQINSIVPNDTAYTPYLYFSMIECRKLLRHLVSGASVTLNLNTSTFSKIKLLDAGAKLVGVFSLYVQPMFDKVLQIENQSIELTQLRDTLLPKLISGELRLPANDGVSIPELEEAAE